jgi:hypothetical protein
VFGRFLSLNITSLHQTLLLLRQSTPISTLQLYFDFFPKLATSLIPHHGTPLNRFVPQWGIILNNYPLLYVTLDYTLNNPHFCAQKYKTEKMSQHDEYCFSTWQTDYVFTVHQPV